MPWKPRDAEGKTHKAVTPRLKSLWASTANGVLESKAAKDLECAGADN